MRAKISVLMTLLILTACNPTGNVVREDKIEVGILAPLTGPNPACGQDMKIGLESAMQTLKENNKDNIRLTYQDTKFSPQRAVKGTNHLLNIENTKIIIGACSSSSTLASAPIAEENKALLFTPTSFSQDISEAGDYIFRLAITPNQDSPEVADFIKNYLNESRVAVIYLNNDYGKSYLDEFKEDYENLGGEVEVSQAGNPTDRDFKTILLKIEEVDIDTVFLPYTSSPSTILVRQAAEMGLDLTFVSTNLVEREEFTKGVQGLEAKVYYVSLVNPEARGTEEFQDFMETKEKVFPDRRATSIRVQSYDTLMLVSDAVRQCGEDTDCVRDYLYSVEDYRGASGEFSMDENGDAIFKDIHINRISKEGFVNVK